MADSLTATTSIEIASNKQQLWKMLTDPELIKQYLFGTETTCDWEAGSPIFFRGEYQGKKYEDKGMILEIIPEKILRYSYWSSLSGTPDLPENYSIVTFEISSNGSSASLRLRQEGIMTEESRKHSEQNWGYVLAAIKKLLEQ